MVDNGLHFRICAEGCKFKNTRSVLCHTNGVRAWNMIHCGFSAFYIKR